VRSRACEHQHPTEAEAAAGIHLGRDRRLESTFNPLAQVQFEEGAFPDFSQSLLLMSAFEDDDEDEYEMPNAKRLVRMQGTDLRGAP